MASAASSRDPRELYLLKQKAVKYYEENGVPVKMEEVLNSMFHEDPPDVYGHLVNFFSQFNKPATLKRLCAAQVFDAMGMPTVNTDVICTVNNNDKCVVSSTIPSTNIKAKPEDREKAEIEMSDSVSAAVKLINSSLSSQLSGIDPRHQSEIDAIILSTIEKLKEEELARRAEEKDKDDASPLPPPPSDDKDKKKSAKDKHPKKEEGQPEEKPGKGSAPVNVIPERPLEVFAPGSEAMAAVSQAVCACVASAHQVPLYRHIANIARVKGAVNEFRIPLPMVTIIQSGKSGQGKNRCVKEYMVVPGVGMTIDKSIQHIQNIYNYVAKSFSTKLGVAAKFVNESGALCPPLDTPTQALDLLQEAVNAQGLTIGEDMYIAINAAAHEFFDFDKGKYEITQGALKTSDDLVEFWADLISKYPSIVAIIDPLRSQDINVESVKLAIQQRRLSSNLESKDVDAWMKLCERISEVTLVVGDHFYVRPGLLNQTEIPAPVRTSGMVMYLEQATSVSDIYKCAQKMQDLNNEIIISTNQGDTTDTFIVDLAVGLNARFFKVGGPMRGERTCKLNRLLEIYRQLECTKVQELPETETPASQAVEKLEGLKELKEEEEDGEDATAITTQGKEAEPEGRTGEDEKSCLKSHLNFSFPLIQNPPPPEEPEEAESEDKDSGRKGK